MVKVPSPQTPRAVWTPRGRTARQVRNSRVKVLGSVVLLVLLLAAVLAVLM